MDRKADNDSPTPERYAIQHWVGTPTPYYGPGAWVPLASTYAPPFSREADALECIARMVDEDLAKAWGAWNGGATKIQPDASDFRPLYRVVALVSR